MKTCPKCGELIGDDCKECFNCHYNYSYGRIITSREISTERQKAEFQKQQNEEQKILFEKEKTKQIKCNPIYEYKTVVVNDNSDGTVNEEKIQMILDEYSSQGWKLCFMFTNEVGKSSATTIVSFLGMNINSTIEQTIIVFERCIKA